MSGAAKTTPWIQTNRPPGKNKNLAQTNQIVKFPRKGGFRGEGGNAESPRLSLVVHGFFGYHGNPKISMICFSSPTDTLLNRFQTLQIHYRSGRFH